jgi:hypothetical protein
VAGGVMYRGLVLCSIWITSVIYTCSGRFSYTALCIQQ